MKVFTSPAGVSCADCGYAIRFEKEADWKAGVAKGRCSGRNGCPNYGKLFNFPLTSVEVEFVDEKDL